MKKLLSLTIIMVFAILSNGQNTDFITKKDFQTEKKGITDQINAAKAPSYELRNLYTKQVKYIDSLALVLATFDQRAASIEKQTELIVLTDIRQQEQINNSQLNVRSQIIFLLVFICIGFLLTFILAFFLWRMLNKKLSTLAIDQEKTNQALNLHIKNTSDEMAAMGSLVAKTQNDLNIKLTETKTTIDQKLVLLSSDIRQTELKTDEKIQGIKTELVEAKSEIETRTSLLASSNNELKFLLEKTSKDLSAIISKNEEIIKDNSNKTLYLENKHKEDFADLSKKFNELILQMADHKKQDHK